MTEWIDPADRSAFEAPPYTKLERNIIGDTVYTLVLIGGEFEEFEWPADGQVS